MTGRFEPEALIVVDVQRDFCAGGALAVPDGDAVVPHINRLMQRHALVVLTQDWHPPGHHSFASVYAGRQPFDVVQLEYGDQTLWPDHCVQGTPGAQWHPDLETRHARLIVRKGVHRPIDSYSAFFENDRHTPTGLSGYLEALQVREVTLCGLATDYCVAWSALDARRLGFNVVLVLPACRAIDQDGSLQRALQDMRQAGVRFIESCE